MARVRDIGQGPEGVRPAAIWGLLFLRQSYKLRRTMMRYWLSASLVCVGLLLGGTALGQPNWLGTEQGRPGGPFASCPNGGPYGVYTLAYDGKQDGSAPGVGDVYSVLLAFRNTGNCVGSRLGETTYTFDVTFSLPQRHQLLHQAQYGQEQFQIRCYLSDTSGNFNETVGNTCVQRVRGVGGHFTIETAGGYDQKQWAVAAGYQMNIIVPVLATRPVTKGEPGLSARFGAQLNAAHDGLDYANLQTSVVVASRPIALQEPGVENVTANSATLKAAVFNRFNPVEVSFLLSPGPLFDSRRSYYVGGDYNVKLVDATWENLEPDTEYTWQAVILTPVRIEADILTFRTPPATAGKRWHSNAPSRAIPTFQSQKVEMLHASQTSMEVADREGRNASVDATMSTQAWASCQAAPVRSRGGNEWVLSLIFCGLLILRRIRPRAISGSCAPVSTVLLLFTLAGGASGCLGDESMNVSGKPADGAPEQASGGSTSGEATSGGGTSGGGASGGSSPPGTSTGSSDGLAMPPLTLMKAPPSEFIVPDGWEIREQDRRAYEKEVRHVIRLSPPGRPDVVLGVRRFVFGEDCPKLLDAAVFPIEAFKDPIAVKESTTDGHYALLASEATLQGKPIVVGGYCWTNRPLQGENDRGTPLTNEARPAFVALLLAPTIEEFNKIGGVRLLQVLAFGQHPLQADGQPEVSLDGNYGGRVVEQIGVTPSTSVTATPTGVLTGMLLQPTTIPLPNGNDLGHAFDLTISDQEISVRHQWFLTLATVPQDVRVIESRGTFVRYGRTIVPSWQECVATSSANGKTQKDDCRNWGWGAVIHLVPQDDGSILVWMPGMTIGRQYGPGAIRLTRR